MLTRPPIRSPRYHDVAGPGCVDDCSRSPTPPKSGAVEPDAAATPGPVSSNAFHAGSPVAVVCTGPSTMGPFTPREAAAVSRASDARAENATRPMSALPPLAMSGVKSVGAPGSTMSAGATPAVERYAEAQTSLPAALRPSTPTPSARDHPFSRAVSMAPCEDRRGEEAKGGGGLLDCVCEP